MTKYCNDCKECKGIKGQAYCAKSARELASGQRKSLLFVKKDAPCYYSNNNN